MEDKDKNIELRSDKVRGVIGQIPPWIIRSGITVILLVIIALLVGSYYFKYPYTITTTVEFLQKNNSFVGFVKIPANEISKIEKGQKVEIYFDKVENISGTVFNSEIREISSEITISNESGFYKVKIGKIENLNIKEQTSGIATIKTEEISFFERIIKPFKVLKTK